MFETGFYVWTLIKSAIRFKEITPPSTGQMGPNTVALYAKDKAGVSNLYFKNDAGTEFDLSSGASGAPNSADYLVKTADAGLTAERVVTDTASITWDWATAGQAKANIDSSGTNGQVLTMVSGAPAWADASGAGSAWSVLTNGNPSAPELVWDSNGDVIMTEQLR